MVKNRGTETSSWIGSDGETVDLQDTEAGPIHD